MRAVFTPVCTLFRRDGGNLFLLTRKEWMDRVSVR